jgi:hypothetical protein
MRLRERCGFVDRREAEENGREDRSGLVVQFPRDPAPLHLLSFENPVDGFTGHAF